MSGIVEKGFSISHEFDGAKLKQTIKETVIKEWVGETSSNVSFSSRGDDSWGNVSVAGESYSNAKISNVDYSFEGSQSFETTTIQEKIDGSSDCDVFCGLNATQVSSHSDSISTTKGKDSISLTRKMSVQIAADDSMASSPSSPSGSAVLDLAVSCLKSSMQDSSGFSSTDPDIQSMIDDSTGTCGNSKIKSSISEVIDKAACSASMTKTVTKDLTGCEEDCSSSKSTSVAYSENGLVSISVNGSFKGEKEDYTCGPNGEKTGISKSKYQYAQGCYAGLDKDSEVLALYQAHQQESCEDDVCLALRVQSEQETHCEKEGTISWSISASEEEVSHGDAGGKNKTKDKTNKNGCIHTITRTFEIVNPVKDDSSTPQNPKYLRGDCSQFLGGGGGSSQSQAVNKSLAQLGGVDLDPPADFFGPLSFNASINPSQGSITGSVSFSNDPEYDTEDNGLIKKQTTTTTVCPQDVQENKKMIPCGAPMTIKSTGSPGSTKICKDFEFYACAEVGDVMQAIDLTAPGGSVVVEDTFSVSVSEGAKTGSACIKYHTPDDLKGQC